MNSQTDSGDRRSFMLQGANKADSVELVTVFRPSILATSKCAHENEIYTPYRHRSCYCPNAAADAKELKERRNA